MKILIGVSGKLGSGKDYITNHVIIPVIEKIGYRYLQCAFADQIKINVMTKNGISYEDVYENKTPESRRLLQTEGTEIGRTQDRNIWVKYLDNWIKVHENRGISVYIISDVRFKNEFYYVKAEENIGLMLKIVARNRNEERLVKESQGDSIVYDKIKNHASECDLDDFTNDMFDMVISNDTIDVVSIESLQYQFERLLYESHIDSYFK
jgi:phosphomevalonate kinase